MDVNNSTYSSMDGVLFDKSQTTLIKYPGGKTGNYTIPNSVTSIDYGAFEDCTSLNGVYFQGNAPTPTLSGDVFNFSDNVTVYYLPLAGNYRLGSDVWRSADRAVGASGPVHPKQWLPLWRPDQLFLVSSSPWATNRPVVVEACMDLAQPIWSPVGTNTLIGGSSYFNDPQWTNYPARFYRLRSS